MARLQPNGCLLLLGLTFAVAACNPFYGARQTRSEIVTDGWVGLGTAPTPGVIYCYRTLAAPDCRTAPEPGQEDRLVSYDGGNYGSPPR